MRKNLAKVDKMSSTITMYFDITVKTSMSINKIASNPAWFFSDKFCSLGHSQV